MSGGSTVEALVMEGFEPGVKDDGGHMMSSVMVRLILPRAWREDIEDGTSEVDGVLYELLLPIKSEFHLANRWQ